jgi:uncharacterized protein YegP (UPF0339 family)
MNAPYFEWYRTRFTKQFRWRMRAGNGEIVASGESYVKKTDMVRALDIVNGHNAYRIIEAEK